MSGNPKLNYLVGKVVMGYDFSHAPERTDYYWDGSAMVPVPDFGAWSGAGEVIDLMEGEGRAIHVQSPRPMSSPQYAHIVGFDRRGALMFEGSSGDLKEAICIAALRAKGCPESEIQEAKKGE